MIPHARTCACRSGSYYFPTNVTEDLEHIGGLLRAARETAGLTVEDVVFRTKLPRSAVVALEAEDFSAFASPVYAKSFLSQYSGFLTVDAQPWLDSLEPGDFMASSLLQPVVRVPDAPAAVTAAPHEIRGGLWSVMGLLGISSALVYAAIKGYDFFESRFGQESRPQAESRIAAPPPAAVVSPVKKKPAVVREDEELGKPPPRAIIVR